MPPNRSFERPWLACTLLVLAVAAVYLPVVELSFLTFDDDYYVARNPHVAGGLTWAGVRWAFTHAHSANWHPLTWLSHMLDCQLYALRPAGHHLTNVLFHAANTLLLFFWLRSLTAAFWRSAFVAALFALHPLHVESVAWVAERKDVLSAFFGLLSLWAYTSWAKSSVVSSQSSETTQKGSTTDHVSRFYLLSLLLFAFGLMSKPMLVTWPFVMLLLDYWPLGRMQKEEGRRKNAAADTTLHALGFTFHVSRGLLLEKLPFFALAIVSSAVTIVAQHTGGALATLAAVPFGVRVLNAFEAYLRYLFQLFWPANLAVIYPFAGSPAAGTAAAGLLVVVGLALVAWWQRKRRPYLAVGWAWYVGTLVPVIGLVQVGNQAMADRYTYLPAIGVFILVAWGASDFVAARSAHWRASVPASANSAEARHGQGARGRSSSLTSRRPSGRLALAAAAAAILVACGLVARAQLQHWRNSETLFRHALKVNRNNFVAWSGLGYYLAEQGQVREAEDCYRAAVEINPSFADAWNGLGFALTSLKRHEEAIVSYETAVRLAPNHIQARNNLATALATSGRLEEAKAQCRAAAEVDPRAADPHSNLGALFAREAKWEEAVAEYRRALLLDPGLTEARCGLAGALARQGNFEEGVRELSALLAAQPSNAPARLQLGVILSRQGQTDRAIAEFTELLRVSPIDPEAHYHLALALAKQGKAKDALAEYRAAIKARPDFPEALNNLAWLLATHPDLQLRNGAEAVDLAERACRLTGRQQAYMLGTLGAAYAEAGQFAEAVAAAEQAKALAEKANDAEAAAMNDKLLALYRARQPYRDTR
jgi:protein O-mannosyl-transferase